MVRQPAGASISSRCAPALAAGVLLLALFNVGIRLNRQYVQEWDESLYAISAWEMAHSGQWVAHTFRGEVDYYNTKPPLNFWLIAASFKVFGTGLISLRLASVLAGLATVAVLTWWTRKHLGDAVSFFSGLVLSTMFAFFHVHACRTANTDAIFTLLILLTVVTLSEAREARWRLLWLGPIFAAVFMLRGMAVIMPAVIVLAYAAWSRQLSRDRLVPALCAAALCLLPIGAWAAARWRFDGWTFIGRLFWYDFVARSVSNIEDHPGTVFYYLDVLQRHHYDWIAAAVAAWLLFPVSRSLFRSMGPVFRAGSGPVPLLAVWAAVAFTIPTLMTTKLAWYLHPFYPVFAIGVGGILAQASAAALESSSAAWRRTALAVVIVAAVGVAEGRLIWHSYVHRDLSRSPQGLLLDERHNLRGRQVFSARWDRSEIFVAEALAGATYKLAHDVDDFLGLSQPGDYFLSPAILAHPRVALAGSTRHTHLYRRID